MAPYISLFSKTKINELFVSGAGLTRHRAKPTTPTTTNSDLLAIPPHVLMYNVTRHSSI